MGFNVLSYLVGDPSHQGQGPTAWQAPTSFETEGMTYEPYDSSDVYVAAQHTGNPSQSFNPGVAGLWSYIGNRWEALLEAGLQQEWGPKGREAGPDFVFTETPPGGGEFVNPPSKLPPSFTYDGPVAGAGFLGLFPPAPGSPEYNAYVNRNNPKVHTEAPVKELPSGLDLGVPIETSGRKPSGVLNQLNKWGGNLDNTWNDFTRGVSEGYNEEKGHEWYDLLPGFSDKSNMPLMLMVGGGILLLILIIK